MQQHNEDNGGKECAVYSDGGVPQVNRGRRPLDPRQSFVLFLENCAPVVNTLNFGVSSPVLLSLPHFLLAQIKTQLALHHLTSVSSNSTSQIYALLNQALLKLSTAHTMFNRGGFPGQMPMGHSPMNQPAMSHPGITMSGMNVSGMNMPGMGMTPMNQPNMNLSGMNHPGMNHQLMGHSGMNHPNIGLSGMNQPGINQPNMNMNQPNMNQPSMNQPNMNLNPMNHPNINQGSGMGFLPEMKNQAFGMRPMDNPGSFVGGNADPMGMKGMPTRSPMQMSSNRHMVPQALPQRFASPNVPVHQGQPRMPAQSQEIPTILNMVLTHSSDRMGGNSKAPLQNPAHRMKKKRWEENVNVFGSVGQDMGMKSVPSDTSLEASNAPTRYTNESASSILKSFGLSNEDLEELSRYPDDQLTPSNMPSILRDIRLRKMNRTTSVPDQAAGRRPGSEAVPSKVIDYGHLSKYQFNNPATPAQTYNSPRNEQKTPPVPKETVTVVNTNPERTPETGMDNKIPTISGSRKPNWSSSKPDRANKNTLVGKGAKAPVNVSVPIIAKNPVISSQPDASAKPNAVTPVQTELTAAVQVVPSASQVTYQQPTETPAAEKNKWPPVSSKEEVQKMKMPTPSMMNDYYAASPRIFPHICSLCNVECRHLKDWIKHQNNLSHIESCRNLRQKYPDWNPQVLASVRNENKKDEPTSHKSESKSVSPRRSRKSGSRHKSRSRSPRSSGRRSRSRSPHKKAVDAAVKSFIEAIKPKAVEKSKSLKTTTSVKKPSNSNVRSKKPVSPLPKKPSTSASKASSTSSSSSSSKKPASSSNSSNNKPSSNSAARKPSSGSASSKPVVSTAAKKTTPSTSSAKKPQPSKPPADEQPPSSPISEEAHNLSNKFTSRNNTRKIVHVTDLPDSGYTDQDLLKIVQPFGRVCDILIVQSKNEAFIETNFREAATAVIKYSETTPIMINNKRVTLSMPGQSKKPVIAEKVEHMEEEPAKAPAETAAPEKEKEDKKSQETSKHDLEVPPGFVKSYMLDDPPLKQNEKCVILISNLPEAQYTVDEIANLAKPFGGVKDILLVANHRKAYLELTNRSSVDSMIKFYGVFPTYLSGNLLSICVAQRYKDLKNEDLIFADLIEQSSYKIIPTIYEKFVHLTDLPEKDVEDFAIIRIGRRFGKVEHHVYFSNKKKAILHLHSPSAAKAMYSFLTQYPCSIADNVVQCSLPSKTELAEDEYISYIEEDTPRTNSNLEKAASEVAESKESDKKEEKPSQPKEEVSNEPDKKEEKPSQSKEKGSNEPDKKEDKSSQPKEKGSNEPDKKEEKPSQPKEKGSKEPNKKDEQPSQPKEKWSKEPNKKDEKPSQPKDKWSKEPNKKDEKPSPHKDKGFKEPNKKDDKPSQPKGKGYKEPNKKDDKPSQPKGKESKEPNKKDEKPSQHKDKGSKEHNKDEKFSQSRDKGSKEHNKKDDKFSQSKDKGSKESSKKDEKPSLPKDKVSKEPNKQEEKSLQPKDKESQARPVLSSPAIQSEMDVDTAECEGPSEPTQSVESEKISGQAAADHPSVELVPSPCMAVTTEDDNDDDINDDDDEDDDEEAAQAPEAPFTSHVCIQAEPEVQHPEPQPVSQPQVLDDLDILVSVESDEEESEGQHNFILNAEQGTQPRPVTDMAKLLDTKTSADKGPSGSSESEGKEVTKDAQNTIGTADEGSNKETSKHSIEKHGHHVPTKGRDDLFATEATETSDGSIVRTAKYYAQKGEISVTVTLENQKSNSKTESRKRTSRERGSSSHESSTPRSSSNRSSPADSAYKTASSFSQKKTTGKYSSSQPERDSKDTRSREREARSSSRWNERMRGSSSRYSRSSKSNNRSPRSKEGDEETFPFNLDEFVTVDEIVEEHVDSVTSAEAEEEKPDAARKGKRKENDPLPSDTKKSRVTSTASHKRSFVTLDEVGDEEENANVKKDQADESAKPLVTTEEGPPASAEQVLMTLDEISDDEDAQNFSTGQQSSKAPEILTKDQLLTLDEVNEEEEEHTTPPKSQEAVETKLLDDKDTKDNGKDPEDKHKTDVQQDAPTNGDHSEQALLTLDEVKAEDDEMSFADIEHQFLTVDEIGEEEEESERKAERKPSDTKESSKAEPTSTVKRGRPRKRPLPQSAEDNKDSSVLASPDTSKGDAAEKSPAKRNQSQGSEGEADGVQSSTSASPDNTESADGKSDADTLAKKAKLEIPPGEKTKLAPFNSNTPVGLEFLVPKTGYFCELCSLFYMDNLSKLKHCRSLRHYQAVEKHLAKL
ncbi:zinc finger protein 638 isoform X2 [Bufo gargarizans]|uniref:zinc finger protein 638 isoform X2 n=1 Tax=Bufo gargarizans TaxID=30331 RepID=UPI001CF4EC6D|nr:zinc finger protein 638 isoform X2 [Bufo gargarizans]